VVAADAIGPLVNAPRLLASPQHSGRLAPVVPLHAARADDGAGCPHAEACGTAPPGLAVDAIDAQLLRLLQADGRISNMRLAEAVGLSPAAVHERVRRLTREGFILGYQAVLNAAKLGTGLLVYAEVRVEGPGPGVVEAFKAAVHVRDEILECHEVAGSFDYLIKTRVPDMRAYRDLVAAVVWALPGVRDVRTYPVMEEVKSTARIAL